MNHSLVNSSSTKGFSLISHRVELSTEPASLRLIGLLWRKEGCAKVTSSVFSIHLGTSGVQATWPLTGQVWSVSHVWVPVTHPLATPVSSVGPASWFHSTQSPNLRRPCAWNLMLCSHSLKILNLIFEVKSEGKNRACARGLGLKFMHRPPPASYPPTTWESGLAQFSIPVPIFGNSYG